MVFLDTNIFVRFLTDDNPELTPRCLALFQQIFDGQVEARTSDCVIHETCYILCVSKLYKLNRKAVSERLQELLSYPRLYINDKDSILAALALFAKTSLDFTDCLIAQTMKEEAIEVVYSYDADFDTLDWVKRHEP